MSTLCFISLTVIKRYRISIYIDHRLHIDGRNPLEYNKIHLIGETNWKIWFDARACRSSWFPYTFFFFAFHLFFLSLSDFVVAHSLMLSYHFLLLKFSSWSREQILLPSSTWTLEIIFLTFRFYYSFKVCISNWIVYLYVRWFFSNQFHNWNVS